MLSKLFFRLLCLTGFIYQVTELGTEYFSYPVITNIKAGLMDVKIAPALTICPYYHHIVDYEKFNRDKNTNLVYKSNNYTTKMSIQKAMTIKDIFEYTPSGEDLINSCGVRWPDSYEFDLKNKSSCLSMFTFGKSFIQEFICYRFSLINLTNKTYNRGKLIYAPVHVDTYYEIFINISKLNGFKVVIDRSQTQSFLQSMPVAPLVTQNLASGKTMNGFLMSFFICDFDYLPYPYKPLCHNYQNDRWFEGDHDCGAKCLNNLSLKELDKVFFSSPVTIPIDKKPINGDDLKNHTIVKFIEKSAKICKQACPLACEKRVTFTKYFPTYNAHNLTYFQIKTSSHLSVKVSFKPKNSLKHFLVFILGCTGSWFGLSMTSLMSVKKQIFKHLKYNNKVRGQQNNRLFKSGSTAMCKRVQVAELNAKLSTIVNRLTDLEGKDKYKDKINN